MKYSNDDLALTLRDSQDGISAELFGSFAATGVSRDEWDQLVLKLDGDVYATYDWCRIWWKHYGANRALRIFVFRRSGHLVGVAPMFIEKFGVGPLSVKIGKRVGSDFALTIFTLPIADDHIEAAYKIVVRALTLMEECDVISFSFMPGGDRTRAGLRRACKDLEKFITVVRDAPAAPHTIFELPDTVQKYLSDLPKRYRQNYRRQRRMLESTSNVVVDVVHNHPEVSEAFQAFTALHARQWQAEGLLGHFGDWPSSRAFNTELVAELAKLNRVKMTRIFSDSELVSAQYAFVFGRRCFWRLPARLPHHEFERFGLGILGLVHLIECMIDIQVKEIEAGVGHYDYKLHYGGKESAVSSFAVVTTRPKGALRGRAFLKLSQFIHLAYYRLWRLRVASYLPIRGPLSRTWIRSRL